MIVNSYKSHAHKRKYLVDIFSLLNMVSGKSGEILHDNTANGRNSFELLKAKVLLHEQSCYEIN